MNRLTLKKLDSPDECLPETSTGKSCTDQSIYKLVQTDSSNSSDSLISDDEETMPEVEEHEDIDPCDMNTKLKTTEPYGKMKRSLSNYRYKNNSDSFGEFQSTESRYTHERKKQKNDAETIETEIKQEPNRKVEETEIKQEPSRKVEETEIKQEPSRKVEETEIKQEPNRKVEETEIKQEPNRKVEETVAQVAIQHEEMIAGIKVKFPVKPDSSQIDIAHKVIQCCMKEENCLLESPSESGRILALLCSVLAWHDHHVADVQKQREKLEASMGRFIHEDPSRNDEPTTSREDDKSENNIFDEEKLKKIKVSKIYYATQTEVQINQVMVELKKTSYKHKKMAILSDREYTCIQHTTRNKTDLCNELLDPMTYKGCAFYNEFNNKTISTFQAAESRGLAPLWDIEDLVTIGKKEGSCPYFAARSLAEEADIIICPYRYIISTDIRESLQIDLKGQVIILDDAHGVEQNSKYASSTSFREDHLQIVKIECEKLVEVKLDGNHEAYKILCLFVTRMLEFLGSVDLIHENVGNPTHIRMSSFWTGPELAELLSIHSMDKSLCEAFINACDTAISDMNKAKEESRFRKLIKPVISSATKKELDHLVFTVRMINLINYTNDYRACVSETIVNDLVTPYSSKWLPTEQHTRILQLFSMNSGVVFEPLAQNARSVILASGSLSPMETYQGELRTSFPNVLKTRHVVPKEQVYATCIPYGPSKLILRGICSNMNTWSYQDEIGRVLLDICESMPHGILCFFSSHDVMHKHVERWRSTSIFDKISNVKPVFFEPECETNLVPMLAKYCYVIRRTSAKKVGNVTGALLLAVFGGKVAEGVYFRDNEARCVVAIGMPYPGNQNYIIRLKMAYNDKNIKNGFLKGSDWFSIQAFRALNQALERCLRHVHDWGALLLIDDRFLQDEYKQNLSEWIKTMWVNPTEYTLKKDLEHFVARQKMRDAKQPGISN